MVAVRPYVIGILTGVLASAAVDLMAHILTADTISHETILQYSTERWVYIIGAAIAILIVFFLLIKLVYAIDKKIYYSNTKKFDFFLYRLNKINQIGEILHNSIKKYLSENPTNVGSIRDLHRSKAIDTAFSQAFIDFLSIIPTQYEGEPSVHTFSIMIRTKYLDINNNDVSIVDYNCFSRDSLEVFHYVDNVSLRPVLHRDFDRLEFSESDENTDEEVFALASAREGIIRMGGTRPFLKFHPAKMFRWITPFKSRGKLDSKKRSILNIPITNKRNKVIAVLSIDSNRMQFTGGKESDVYIKNILTNFIDSIEQTMLIMHNAIRSSEKK